MQNLLAFFQRYGHLFVFLLLELLFIGLYVQFNNYPRAATFSTANRVASGFYSLTYKVERFFTLSAENERLAEENMRLRQIINASDTSETGDFPIDSIVDDSLDYTYIHGRAIENSIKRATNFVTINRGRADGVEPYMGIINSDGVVGIVSHVSEHFCAANSLLNVNTRISATLEGSGNFGTLIWDGEDPKIALLKEINIHVPVKTGDRVLTSGFSGIFPRGLLIGTVKTVERKAESNFYEISVDLAVDFGRLDNLYIIKYPLRSELDSLQNLLRN